MGTRYDVMGPQDRFEPGSNDLVLANKLGITKAADIDEAELVLLQKLYEWVLSEHPMTNRIVDRANREIFNRLKLFP